MNPVEIEEAVSQLALEPFDRGEFPFSFLRAFGNPETTIKRLRTGLTNQSDVGGVLQRSNIHIATCNAGEVEATLGLLRDSPKTATAKSKFILATDGDSFQAEDRTSGETVACDYADFPDHFGFFLPLAGITTVEQIRESSFDIRATGRLNKLYVELLKDNPDWANAERRPDMNHFMARLIFCFFAEDTDIFVGEGLFTKTVEQMSARDSSDTHTVISEIFRSMDTKIADRQSVGIARYANQFPYVNGQLFSGSTEVPRFTKIARSYLNHIGNLNWKKINPDIFGSMIQAVADDEERGALGMHYTSVPNILKVLNPLFLDDLRGKLEEAGDNGRKLLNLRNRMARIRVFDPACGSGNFLVISYKQMREIEAEINRRRGEPDRRSEIPLTNFRGIELRDFAAEIARLALIIAEFQCDVLHRGQQEALAEFLPLNSENWITCGDALRLDWLNICPPTGTGVRVRGDDLFETPLNQSEIDFENAGGETYLCGNPPYIWSNDQSADQKSDLLRLQQPYGSNSRILDYVAGWLLQFLNYAKNVQSSAAFVTTNSITQGSQVDPLWKSIFEQNVRIFFAHTAFKWANLASRNAGVTCVIIGLTTESGSRAFLYDGDGCRETSNISPYLLPMENVWIKKATNPINSLPVMLKGNQPTCGGGLILSSSEYSVLDSEVQHHFIRNLVGADEIASGAVRYCIWVENESVDCAMKHEFIQDRLQIVRNSRLESTKKATQDWADRPHRFTEIRREDGDFLAIPCVASESREYLTPVILSEKSIITNRCFGIYSPSFHLFSLLSSRMHWLWVESSSGKLETRINYSNTLSWNTFPLPKLTEKNKDDLTRCAEAIILMREAHFPATIAELYDPDKMPNDLRRAHEENDEVLERIYIGRRFRNDTERLEKLFDLYAKMTAKKAAA
ncbi:class I SAM-dependent DNA methyltransferase [Novosphingobium sp. BL-52-GroH]|uniref:class I SAM-dependent DNA methyltransferase n=1 Tax=Novosphingobium sp. BL-52-GroH TaxID=3349877 RepID=UPI00384D523E